MTNYCTPIPILHVATLPRFLLKCEIQLLRGQKHRIQQHIASRLAETVHLTTQAPPVHRAHRPRLIPPPPPLGKRLLSSCCAPLRSSANDFFGPTEAVAAGPCHIFSF